MMRRRLATNFSPKNGERIAIVSITGDYFGNRVAAGDQDGEDEHDSAPLMNAGARFFVRCSHQPACLAVAWRRGVAGQIRIVAGAGTAHTAVATGIAAYILCRTKQA